MPQGAKDGGHSKGREHAYMDVGGRAMQEQLPRSKYLSVHAVHIRIAIPGSLRYTVHPVHKKKPTINGRLKRVLRYEKNN